MSGRGGLLSGAAHKLRGTKAHLVAGHAFHPVSKLPLEIVDDEAVVRPTIKIPFLLAGNLGRKGLQFGLAFRARFNVIPLENPVQVLVETIEQKYHELLCIVLIRIGESRRESANSFLLDN